MNDKDYEEKFRQEFINIKSKIKKPNVLIAGATGVGKSSLINHIFGKEIANVGVGRPVTQNIDLYESDKTDVRIFDSRGYETCALSDDNFFNDILNLPNKTNDPDDAIHIIWYCISCSNGRVQEFDLNAISTFSNSKIPVAILLTKADLISEEDINMLRQALPQTYHMFEVTIKEPKYDHTKELIDWSIKKLPEGVTYAFIKSQKHNLKAKWEKAHSIITQHCAISFGIGFLPIPMSDAPLLVANEITLMARLLYLYGLGDLNNLIKSTLISTLVKSFLTKAGKSVVGSLLKFIPIMGSIVGGLINASVGATITAAFGEAVSMVSYVICDKIIAGEDYSVYIDNFGPMVMEVVKNNFKANKKPEDYKYGRFSL